MTTTDNKAKREIRLVTPEESVELIRQAQQQGGKSLLVVTTDASGGGKCSGLAAVLRRVGRMTNNVPKGEREPTTTTLSDGETSKNVSLLVDRVKVVVGRVDWDESTAAEIAAQAMAMDAARRECFRDNDILLLTDCESVLCFFDPAQNTTLQEELLDAPAYEGAKERLLEACSGQVVMGMVKSAHNRPNTFFDHQAADLISKTARDLQVTETFSHDWVDCPALSQHDMEWLKMSVTDAALAGRKRQRPAATREQKRLNVARIQKEFGITCHNYSAKRQKTH